MPSPLRSASAALLACCLALAWSCGEPADRKSVRLERELVLGWKTLADSVGALSPSERRYGGGVLGSPMDLAVNPATGEVFVLDAAYHKVAVFGPDGAYRRLIPGGPGKGPGEFVRPRAIVIDAQRNVWVYDQVLGRISQFSPNGRFLRQLDAPGSAVVNMAMGAGHLFLARLTRGQPGLIVVDTFGQVVAEMASPSASDTSFVGRSSAVPAVGETPPGEIIIGHGDVGWWSIATATTESRRRGRSLFPAGEPLAYVSEGGISGSVPVAEPWHAGQLADGTVVLFFAQRNPEDPLARPAFKLAVFDSTGAEVGIFSTRASTGTFGHSTSENAVYLTEESPYPQIVKYLVLTH